MKSNPLLLSGRQNKGSLLVSTPKKGVVDQTLLMKEINEFLREQKKIYRVVFAQKYWYFLDIKRIAELNHISESKVGSILHRMRKKLKKKLEKEGYRI